MRPRSPLKEATVRAAPQLALGACLATVVDISEHGSLRLNLGRRYAGHHQRIPANPQSYDQRDPAYCTHSPATLRVPPLRMYWSIVRMYWSIVRMHWLLVRMYWSIVRMHAWLDTAGQQGVDSRQTASLPGLHAAALVSLTNALEPGTYEFSL